MLLRTIVAVLTRRPPPGQTLAEARLAGIVPPEGWRPPRRASVADAARTAGALAWLARRFLHGGDGRPAADTTSAEALARLRPLCREVLDRLKVRLEVRDADRVPERGGLVFMWNQTSHLDHVVLPLAIPRPFHTTYNNEVRNTPLYGRRLRASEHFWLDRTDETQWRAQLAAAAARVQAGACVLVSPEGTRSWDGRLLPMKRGAFRLARSAGRPIVCVIVDGARSSLPRGAAAVRPGVVRVSFASPIEPVDTDEPLERRVTRIFERALGLAA
jgi:1-acyl-sn-glycerol-3-phosphate acyltransferase